MDSEAAQYFVKLHIIAGQMTTEHMNNTDTFYTLTGRSGTIVSGDKVRVSLMLALGASAHRGRSLWVCRLGKVTKNFSDSLSVKAPPYTGRSRKQYQKGSGRRRGCTVTERGVL